MNYDLVLRRGRVIDAASGHDKVCDLGIRDGKVAAVEPDLPESSAERVIDVEGYIVMPGMIDSHVHVSSKERWVGFAMLAAKGVVTAVDFGGPIESTLAGLLANGCGLGIAGLHTVRPGSRGLPANPTPEAVGAVTDRALEGGAIGLKMVGGHSPATPEDTAKVIDVANKKGAYVAFHVGTTETGSDIEGFHEAVRLAGKNRLHIAHVNSYCRGLHKAPAAEALEALEALRAHRNLVSESYLGNINGTSAGITNGLPGSHVTRNCLKMGGYEVSEKGMGEAILGGWARIQVLRGGEIQLVTGKEGYDLWVARGTRTGVSFPVNDTTSMHILAAGKTDDGQFVIDGISTDGGAIPRNVQLEKGAALVRLGALTWPELVWKLTIGPARMFGFEKKGSFGEGFDADVTVVEPVTGRPNLSIARGQIVMIDGVVVGKGGHLLTTERGLGAAESIGLSAEAVDLGKSRFYAPL